MVALLQNLDQISTVHMSSNIDQKIAQCDQSMSNKHICPCCSYTLLRHINLDGIYWYCSHCHQEIAVYN